MLRSPYAGPFSNRAQSPFGISTNPFYGVTKLFHVDPEGTGARTAQTGVSFDGTSKHLSAADHADFDFSTVEKFSVAFWKSSNVVELGNDGLDRCYIAQTGTNVASNVAFTISSGDGTNTGNQIRIIISHNGTTQYGYRSSSLSTGTTWSNCVVTFDLTTGTPDINIYLDGVLQSKTLRSGTPVQGIFNSTATIQLGNAGGVWAGNHVQKDTAVWKDRILSQQDITDLFNGGLGYSYASLPAGLLTSMVTWWHLGGGDLTDATGRGHTLTAQNGSLLSKSLYVADTNYASSNFTMRSKGATPVALLANTDFCGAPRLSTATLNGHFGYETMPVVNGLITTGLSNPIATNAIDIFAVVTFKNITSVEYFWLGKTNTESQPPTGQYFLVGGRNGNPAVRIETSLIGDWVDAVGFSLTNDVPYLINIRITGVGGTASYAFRVNGVEASEVTYTTSSMQNSGPNSIDGGNCLAFNEFNLAQANQGGLQTISWESIVTAGTSLAKNREIERHLLTKFGL
jgi:hypothetical protein